MESGRDASNSVESPIIEVQKDGPYFVRNLKNLRNSKGVFIETMPLMVLCRCGGSHNKPFCDGTHIEIGFNGDKNDERVIDHTDTYEGKNHTIHDNRGVCSHVGHCTDNAPKVFRMKTEPWIDPDADDQKHVEKVILMCPSGALSYSRDGELHKEWGNDQEIFIGKNRSYHISGNIQLDDPDGNKPETRDHYCLCRCGGSKNKPFCDGTHYYNDFEDEKN